MIRRRPPAPKAPPLQDETGKTAGPDVSQQQRDTAEYLADMILELRNLARSVRLHTVMVPLEFAYYEAFGVARRVAISESEVERIRELARVSDDMDRDPGNAGI